MFGGSAEPDTNGARRRAAESFKRLSAADRAAILAEADEEDRRLREHRGGVGGIRPRRDGLGADDGPITRAAEALGIDPCTLAQAIIGATIIGFMLYTLWQVTSASGAGAGDGYDVNAGAPP
uniref:Uncharacterized protein n=1 Tax=Bicosoecida sp. CB-2014 TaxID=1486930 RepID=A0A7S1CKV5_9STRA|mmetsp:Transcript_4677/g.16964  ORF Transcript_4677/g.16964 Transcript_4677/m.16964 type:complete len:122 (+) Transcript_4677:183-548(+)